MSEIVDKTRQYLLGTDDIPDSEKKYAMDFCKKMDYLNRLRDTVVNETHVTVATGYGNVNSKICFVFANEETFQLVKPVVQDILESFRLNLWDVYITFIDKTPVNYNGKYAYLTNELYAVNPKLLYVVGKDESIYNNINKAFDAMGIPHPAQKTYHISLIDLCSSDEESKKKLWKIFKFLINYKN